MSVLRDLRTLAVHAGFRKLFAVRLVSQCGDGMFQVGLATLFFFNPQNMATAGGVAAAFAVLLLPFTVVGPFAGPLLDRWRRRQVLLYGNALRVLLALVLAVLIGTTGVSTLVYVLALVTLGVNRFLLAALSAGLPRVVPRDQLLMANTLTPTLGAVSAVVGAVLGLLVGLVVPAGLRPGRQARAQQCRGVVENAGEQRHVHPGDPRAARHLANAHPAPRVVRPRRPPPGPVARGNQGAGSGKARTGRPQPGKSDSCWVPIAWSASMTGMPSSMR